MDGYAEAILPGGSEELVGEEGTCKTSGGLAALPNPISAATMVAEPWASARSKSSGRRGSMVREGGREGECAWAGRERARKEGR